MNWHWKRFIKTVKTKKSSDSPTATLGIKLTLDHRVDGRKRKVRPQQNLDRPPVVDSSIGHSLPLRQIISVLTVGSSYHAMVCSRGHFSDTLGFH